MTTLKLIVSCIVFGAIVDFIWIGTIMSGFYKAQMSSIARLSGSAFAPNIPSAIGVYIVLACLIVFFVLPRTDGTILNLAIYGALFGFLIYCFYDLTNYSLLKNWSLTLTVVDIAWGTVLCALTTVVAGWLQKIY